MRASIIFLAVALLQPGVAVSGGVDGEARVPAIDALAWLAGEWRLARAGRVTDEHWMPPAGGVMLGMSRTVAKGRAIEHEFFQIREGPHGGLYFIATPSGQKETTFRLASWERGRFVFENPAHDFPQRVVYERKPDGSLLAAIEGERGGEARRIEFHFQRVSHEKTP